MKKFTITTLGCRVNQSESAAISEALSATGLIHSEAVKNTDNDATELCIINTCTVTTKASMQSRQAIRRAMRNHPKARIIVTGCYAQTDPGAIKKISTQCEIVGHLENAPLNRIVDSATFFRENISPTPSDKSISPGLLAIDGTRTRPVVKVQDGCNSFCTYCIVPYARGRSRSVPLDAVIEQITRLDMNGYHEAVLSGIHLGCYGRDLNPETDLLTLLKGIINGTRIHRIRLSSIEPLELVDPIIDLATASNRICRHFHIPLQSGDNTILKRMGRPYRSGFFKDLVIKIKNDIPDASIGVDTLIGFPGETEKAFKNTFDLIKSLPVSYLHVFPFSARPNTPAADFDDQVAPEVIKKRTKHMRKLGALKKRSFYEGLIGKKAEVLIESKRDKASGRLKGITSNYVAVLLDGDDHLKNQIVQCDICAVDKNLKVSGKL
jgi:threonylcarbamoyladenosine tRNA methylthiotransferase MtaB